MKTKPPRARKPAALPAPERAQRQISNLPLAPTGAISASTSIEPRAACCEPTPLTEASGQLSRIVGTRSPELATLLLNQAYRALPASIDQAPETLLKTALPALAAVSPRDELEGMLAVQLVAVHNVAMHQLSRAAHPDQPPPVANAAVNNATKLLRAFSQQLETLNRYRGKGQQKVTVEHVHVHSGGQAVVGAIEAPQGRGGRE